MNTAQTLLIPFEEYETNVLSQINQKFNELKSKVKTLVFGTSYQIQILPNG